MEDEVHGRAGSGRIMWAVSAHCVDVMEESALPSSRNHREVRGFHGRRRARL